MGCARYFCEGCGEEMIHRDNRKPWESSSNFGQIVHRMPRTFTYGDVDGYAYKRRDRLLRLIEHKQPTQLLRYAQREVLDHLDAALALYAPTVGLHPKSGVYVVRGPLTAAMDGRRECEIAGPQTVTNLRFGAVELEDGAAVYQWLDGAES